MINILIERKLSSNLDWLEEQPNGEEKQNYVALDLHKNNSLSGSLYDVGGTVLNCAVCFISGKLINDQYKYKYFSQLYII